MGTPSEESYLVCCERSMPQCLLLTDISLVQKRAVALVMVDLLRTLDMAYIRPHALVGGPTANLQAQVSS